MRKLPNRRRERRALYVHSTLMYVYPQSRYIVQSTTQTIVHTGTIVELELHTHRLKVQSARTMYYGVLAHLYSYDVRCTMYDVLTIVALPCTLLYTVELRDVGSPRLAARSSCYRAMYTCIQCTCTQYIVHSTLYIVHRTMYIVRVRCTIWTSFVVSSTMLYIVLALYIYIHRYRYIRQYIVLYCVNMMYSSTLFVPHACTRAYTVALQTSSAQYNSITYSYYILYRAI